MTIQKKWFILIAVILLLPLKKVNAVTLFEDSFNGFSSGWTPSINSALYPWTTDETYNPEDPGDNGGGIGITNYEPSIYPVNQRTNSNSWNGWVQYPNSTGRISIEPTGGVNNSPVLRIRLIKYSGLSNETGLQKWLGNTRHQEIYVQYKFRFGTNAGDWWWNGLWANGDPVAPNLEGGIIWKLARVWTGFNPTDYDKTGGQSQPVIDSVYSRESNWRTGIWIPAILASKWSLVKNTVFFTSSNFHWDLSCTYPQDGTCDSQNNPRSSNMYWEWERFTDNLVPLTSYGMIHNFANSGNPLNASTGAFTENQVFHTIEMRFKNRSNPGVADGAHQIWIDGVDITNDTNMSSKPIMASMSADPDDYGINFIRFVDNFNQLTQNIPDNPGYMDYFIDDVVISTAYVGLDYTIGGTPSDTSPPTGSISINNGTSTANSTNVNLSLSAIDASGVTEMKISNSNNVNSVSAETYSTVKSWVLSAGDGLKTVYAWFKDAIGNWMSNPTTDTITLSTLSPTCTSFTYSDWNSCQVNNTQVRTVIASLPSACIGGNPVLTNSCIYVSSGGSGSSSGSSSSGGNSAVTLLAPTATSTNVNNTASSTNIKNPSTEKIDLANEAISNQNNDKNNLNNLSTTNLSGQTSETVNSITAAESVIVANQKQKINLNQANIDLYVKITNNQSGLSKENRYSIAYFIQYGTPTTQKLGSGERAGVINSYKNAYNKLPKTVEEWQDLIKIANGRWIKERSELREKKVKTEMFKKVYQRDPNSNNSNDNNAVQIMAYGLRPSQRSINSEKISIKTFRHIYGRSPISASDWDIVRAIAYSGAKR